MIEEIKVKLEAVLTPKRFKHSINVMDTSGRLAKRYNTDTDIASLAGLLHDCARDIKGEEAFRMCRQYNIIVDEVMRKQPELLHGPIGSKLAISEYNINDQDILNAICNHTTGRPGMSLLEKIVFIADYIEPGRSFPGVDEARELAYADIDKSMLYALDKTIKHVMAKGALIHPNTINARNYMILNRKMV